MTPGVQLLQADARYQRVALHSTAAVRELLAEQVEGGPVLVTEHSAVQPLVEEGGCARVAVGLVRVVGGVQTQLKADGVVRAGFVESSLKFGRDDVIRRAEQP